MSRKTEITRITGKFTKKNPEKRKFLSRRVMNELKGDEARVNAICKREGKDKNCIYLLHCGCTPDCMGFIVR